MTEFFYGIFQNIIADIIFATAVVTLAWLAARRIRWRVVASVFSPSEKRHLKCLSKSGRIYFPSVDFCSGVY
jgi:hypothetical protein